MNAEFILAIALWCHGASLALEKECRVKLYECVRTAIHPEECFAPPPGAKVGQEVGR
jgi:hypothetical protein